MAELACIISGPLDAPPVLLLHGFLGSGEDWREVMEGLPGLRCIAPDLPGHGHSLALDDPDAFSFEAATALLAGLLDELGVETCAVVGYSMGGRLALHFALQCPERCDRLVLESASPGLKTGDGRAARIRSDEALALRLESGSFDEFISDWYRQPLFEPLAQSPGFERLLASRRRGDPLALARALRGLGTGRQPSLWERLPELRVPALFVAGALDPKFAATARQMAADASDARAEIVAGAGHTVHAERPPAFTDLLKSFLSVPS
jgi:2-succinyl-6-hydroxy-2,4-cyclohexadiene-1-carboxylate synthase